MKDYMRAYYEVLKRIENLLITSDIPSEKLKELMPYIDKFKLDIHKNYTNYEYLLNMSNLMYIYEEFLKYNKEENIIPTTRTKIIDLENEIFKIKNSISKTQNFKYRLWLELVTCVTITATLISIPINHFKDNKSSKRLYATHETTYTLVDNLSTDPLASYGVSEIGSNLKSDDTLLYEFYEKNRATLKVDTKYLEMLPYLDNFVVKKYYPWQINAGIASRNITTYEIKDENLINLFNEDTITNILANIEKYDLKDIIYSVYNLEDVLANSKSESTIETKKASLVDKTNRLYGEPYYEFVFVNQDLNDYFEVNDPHQIIDYLLLAMEELLIYALAVSFFENTLLLTYLSRIVALSTCYNLNKKEEAKLNRLLYVYRNLIKASKKETGITKKRLLI